VLVTNAEKNQRRQPFRVGRHPIHIHAFALELFADESAHMFVACSRDRTRLQSEPGRSAGDVRWRTADIFVERPHVFEPSTNLRTIQINARASDGDDIKGLHPSSPLIPS